ncbi:MAG: hypothetical protein Q8N99_04255 [Nanoarchaeota archaeon]|nr:hypothetical protein [Nanoarchaeota archaeon]
MGNDKGIQGYLYIYIIFICVYIFIYIYAFSYSVNYNETSLIFFSFVEILILSTALILVLDKNKKAINFNKFALVFNIILDTIIFSSKKYNYIFLPGNTIQGFIASFIISFMFIIYWSLSTRVEKTFVSRELRKRIVRYFLPEQRARG